MRGFFRIFELLLSEFIHSMDARVDRLEDSLNFKLIELQNFNKNLETNLVKEIVETRRQNQIQLNLFRPQAKSFALYGSLQSLRTLTTKREIIDLNKKVTVRDL